MPTEFEVYTRLVEFLKAASWQVVCASPPGGTNGRYRKCLLPRRRLDGGEKGPRDEVDLTAHDGQIILLAECKAKLSESLTSSSSVLKESDYTKLKRIARTFPPEELAILLNRAYGLALKRDCSVALLLAVGQVDCQPPGDISIVECGTSATSMRAVGELAKGFPSS